MTDSVKRIDWYKIGFLSVCGAVFILTLYLAAYGAIDRAYAFAEWLNGGMHPEHAAYIQCNRLSGDNELTPLCKSLKSIEVTE